MTLISPKSGGSLARDNRLCSVHIIDNQILSDWLANNPPPRGLGEAPEEWGDLSPEQWDDAYGWLVLVAAERWADAMEAGLADTPGATIADVADAAELAVRKGLGQRLTPFQWSGVVLLLSLCWEHGDELKRWSVGAHQPA